MGNFYTPLRLVDALNEYDSFFALSRRRYVPPNFAEMRHVLNIAQVRCLARSSPCQTEIQQRWDWRHTVMRA